MLTGGAALLENIDELFSRETGVSVRLGKAAYGIDEESQQNIGTYSHSTAVAVLLFGAERGVCSAVGHSATATNRAGHSVEPAPKPETVVRPTEHAKEPVAEPVKPAPQAARPVEQTVEPVDNTPVEQDYDDEEEHEEKRGGLLGRLSNFIDKMLGTDKEKEYL